MYDRRVGIYPKRAEYLSAVVAFLTFRLGDTKAGFSHRACSKVKIFPELISFLPLQVQVPGLAKGFTRAFYNAFPNENPAADVYAKKSLLSASRLISSPCANTFTRQ